jgi:eukaryotic-like serine/threonine-protein kinase
VDPERWRQVEELYHATLRLPAERRTGLLEAACKDDCELRKEVESLLKYETSARDFIEKPAFEFAAKLMADDKSTEDQEIAALSGTRLGRFRILEKLGVGGMGIVYKAEDTRLHRKVALKFLPPELKGDPLALERFQREARAASSLNHPNICTIYDIDESTGQPFISMELLEGQTLEQRISGMPRRIEEVVKLGGQIADALSAAHACGILHRDIKPSNIFVTTRGEAKILDFGLAKLQGADTSDSDPVEHGKTQPKEVSKHAITLTGVAMGTAGYMSPEQVRGEKLDLRTDLFSLGLVLYEMATGKRAFKGETGPVLQEAILKEVPIPVREVNPELPARFEEIIDKAIKKNREERYQLASDICADLENLEQGLMPGQQIRKWMVASGALAALLMVCAILWFTNHQSASSSDTPDLKLRQLTSNSSENGVISGAISPDGHYLAYSDINGMHIKTMEKGEIKSVLLPEEFKGKEMNWEVVPAWLPDGTTFVANAHLGGGDYGNWGSHDSSIWLVSALGMAPHKLREEARAYAISPDGALISFATNEPKRGIWQIGVDGRQAKMLFSSNEHNSIDWLTWSQDQKRFIYVKIDQAGNAALVSSDVNGGPATTLLSSTVFQRVDEMLWLPDGRLLYELPEPESQSTSHNYWVVRINLHTGEQVEKPRRVTNWTGFSLSSSSATADGKRLVFRQWTSHTTVQLSEFDPTAKRIVSTRHFTLSETPNYVYDWTPDSRTMIFGSYRDGYHRIYKQALNEDAPIPVVDGEIDFRAARVSPDGKWIVGLIWPLFKTQEPELRLARVPITGGKPELIAPVLAHPWSMIFCARPPSDLCAIANPTNDRKELVVTAFDPVKGMGLELIRLDLDPNVIHWFCEISPDGTRLAAMRGPEGPIQILSLRGHPARVIRAKDLKNLQSLSWAADGNGLFVSQRMLTGMRILYVDLEGNEKVLWNNDRGNQDDENRARQSPDGKHLAIQDPNVTSNMWMMENF